MVWTRDLVVICVLTFVIWFLLDATYTALSGVRGFSQFFTHDPDIGRTNKPSFKGRFGGFLHNFSSTVSTGTRGERNSAYTELCENSRVIFFLGDSVTAGFEVNDSQTFVSLINKTCEVHGYTGINFGVRGHDTHAVLAVYRKHKELNHSKVFYLINGNDFKENISEHIYKNMTLRFGRFYEGKVLKPASADSSMDYFLRLRGWFGDNFYITTRFLELMEMRSRGESTIYTDQETLIKQVELVKMFELLEELGNEIESKGASLYVAFSPTSRGIPGDLIREKLFEQMVGARLTNVHFLELRSFIQDMERAGCLKQELMTFPNDNHLSEFGHRVVSDFIRFTLINDLSVKNDHLCYR